MGLAIIKQGGKSCPRLTCDSCGRPIENWNHAIANFAPAQDGSTSAVHIYHKGDCDPSNGHWQPLNNYMPWLLCNHNAGIIKHTGKGTRITVDVPEPLEI